MYFPLSHFKAKTEVSHNTLTYSILLHWSVGFNIYLYACVSPAKNNLFEDSETKLVRFTGCDFNIMPGRKGVSNFLFDLTDQGSIVNLMTRIK